MNSGSARTAILAICGAAALLSAACFWLGWVGGNETLIRFSANFQAMVPTTAASFLLLTVALIGIGTGSDRGDWAVLACVRLVTLMVIVNVAFRVGIHDDGLDTLLPFWSATNDRMSFATAGLLLFATYLIHRTALTRKNPPLSLLGGSLAGITTTGSVAMCHALDVNSPYRLPACDGISLYSLTLFGLVFSALLLLHLTGHMGSEEQDDYV